jgi:hypothetical protein
MIERAQYVVSTQASSGEELQTRLPLTADRTSDRGHVYPGGAIARESLAIYERAAEDPNVALRELLDRVRPITLALAELQAVDSTLTARAVLSSVQARDGGLTLAPDVVSGLATAGLALTLLRHETDAVVYALQHWSSVDAPTAAIGVYSEAEFAREAAIEGAVERGGYGVEVTRIAVDDPATRQTVGWSDATGVWALLAPAER